MKTIVGILLLSPGNVSAQRMPWSPLPDGTLLTEFTSSGKGCAENTVTASLDIPKAFVNVTFTNYTARLAPDTLVDRVKEYCILIVSMRVPENRQISLYDDLITGNMTLGKGALARFRTSVTANKHNNTYYYPVSHPRNYTYPIERVHYIPFR